MKSKALAVLALVIVGNVSAYSEINEWKSPDDFFVKSGDLYIMTEMRAAKLKEVLVEAQKKINEKQETINYLIELNQTFEHQDCT